MNRMMIMKMIMIMIILNTSSSAAAVITKSTIPTWTGEKITEQSSCSSEIITKPPSNDTLHGWRAGHIGLWKSSIGNFPLEVAACGMWYESPWGERFYINQKKKTESLTGRRFGNDWCKPWYPERWEGHGWKAFDMRLIFDRGMISSAWGFKRSL